MKDAGYRIALLPGDGTGPEVIHAGRRVLDAVAEGGASPWKLEEHEAGAVYYRDHGKEWAPGAEQAARSADAILLGAVGWPGVSLPNGDIAGAGLIFGLRFGLDLFANVRPCRLYPGVRHRVSGEWKQVWTPENVDFVIIRENTEGLYTPIRGALNRGGETEVAIDTRVITRKGAERVIRYAFDLARRRGRGAPEDKKRRERASIRRTCCGAASSSARCSKRSVPSIPTSNASTRTSTPSRSGWSGIRSITTSWSPPTCSGIS